MRILESVAPVELSAAGGHRALLVERFDRVPGTKQRRAVVSALTILGLGEMFARYASYATLAQHIRESFTAPQATLRELFARARLWGRQFLNPGSLEGWTGPVAQPARA